MRVSRLLIVYCSLFTYYIDLTTLNPMQRVTSRNSQVSHMSLNGENAKNLLKYHDHKDKTLFSNCHSEIKLHSPGLRVVRMRRCDVEGSGKTFALSYFFFESIIKPNNLPEEKIFRISSYFIRILERDYCQRKERRQEKWNVRISLRARRWSLSKR